MSPGQRAGGHHQRPVADWRAGGLQSRSRGFDSRPGVFTETRTCEAASLRCKVDQRMDRMGHERRASAQVAELD